MKNEHLKLNLNWSKKIQIRQGNENESVDIPDIKGVYALFSYHCMYSPLLDDYSIENAVLLYIGKAEKGKSSIKKRTIFDHIIEGVGRLGNRENVWCSYAEITGQNRIDYAEKSLIFNLAPALNSQGLREGTLRNKFQSEEINSITITNEGESDWLEDQGHKEIKFPH